MIKSKLRLFGWAVGLSLALGAVGVAGGIAVQTHQDPIAAHAVADVTFSPSDFSGQGTSQTGSLITATISGVTFSCDKGYGTTQFRCYSGSKITISSTKNIAEITFTWSGSYTGGLQSSYTALSTTSWEKTLASQARLTSVGITFASDFGTLASIEVAPASSHLAQFDSGESYSSSGLVIKATDTASHTKLLDSGFTTNYDGHTFVDGEIGQRTVTVTYQTKTTTYNIQVLPTPVYSASTASMSGWSASGTVFANGLLTTGGKSWRISEGEYYEGSSSYIFGDYSTDTKDNTDKCLWANFAGKKYYSSIAGAMTDATHTYGFALYTQNFVVNRPSRIAFTWTSTSNIGANAYAYILASTNGGYSWTKLTSLQEFAASVTSIVWSGNDLNSSDNVLIALGFATNKKSAQLLSVAAKFYGSSITTANKWAVREVSISGASSVEAAQTITLSASAVTSDYEAPANTNINWSSSNEAIATVSNAGVVTGVAEGNVNIIATAADGNGASASMAVSVTPKLKRLGTITLNTASVQKSFVRNSQFNYNNLVVTANYANGFASETVTPTTVTPPDMTTVGNDKTVTVTYEINGTSASATYQIDVTPIPSSTVSLSGAGISLVGGRYKLTAQPNDMIDVTVTYDGDEASFTTNSDNENIYFEDGVIMIESTENDSGTIEFIVNSSAKAYLDVTVNADETLTIVSPANGEISGIVHQTIDFSLSLINAASAEWTVTTNAAYEATVVGDKNGCLGSVTLLGVCEDLVMTVSATTSTKTLTAEFSLTATADSITGISVKTAPTKTTYIVDETFDPSGLVISASRASGVPYDLSSSEYTIKDAPTVLSVRGPQTITVELNSDKTKTASFNITVNKPSGLKIVTKVSNHDGGYAGTLVTNAASLKAGDKVIIVASAANLALSATQNPNNRGEAAITKDGSSATWSNTAGVQIFTLEEGAVDGTFAFNTGSGYIYAASSGNNYLRTQNGIDENASFRITIDNGAAAIVAQGTNTRNIIRHNDSSHCFSCYGSGQKDVQIFTAFETEPTYSYNLVDATDGLFDFVHAVYNNSAYYTCDPSGTGSNLTNWNGAANSNEFKALNETEKGILANAVLRSEDGTKVTSAMFADYISQYDYVVKKLGQSSDYLGRVSAGTLTLAGAVSPFARGNDNARTPLLVAAFAGIGALAVGGLFFLRKRKEF